MMMTNDQKQGLPEQPDTEPVDEQPIEEQQQDAPIGDRVVKRGPVGVRQGIAPSPSRPGGDDSS